MMRLGFGYALVTVILTVGCSSGGGSGQEGSGGAAGSPTTGAGSTNGSYVLTVDASQNALVLGPCGVAPATFAAVPPGAHTLTLTASTLTKGGVSGPKPAAASHDDYVIVHVPLPPGDAHEDHRFFMLNGIGASASVTLPNSEQIDVMFVDSDTADNGGTGTVTLGPEGATATVSGTMNLISYDTACHSTPAAQTLSSGQYRVTLMDSTLSSGGGAHDDYVLVRTPSEQPMDPNRYVILNGVGASADFTPFNSTTVRIWYIGASPGTGQAHVLVSRM
jgi:hypothetical protein